jgi:hypothetical protein
MESSKAGEDEERSGEEGREEGGVPRSGEEWREEEVVGERGRALADEPEEASRVRMVRPAKVGEESTEGDFILIGRGRLVGWEVKCDVQVLVKTVEVGSEYGCGELLIVDVGVELVVVCEKQKGVWSSLVLREESLRPSSWDGKGKRGISFRTEVRFRFRPGRSFTDIFVLLTSRKSAGLLKV